MNAACHTSKDCSGKSIVVWQCTNREAKKQNWNRHKDCSGKSIVVWQCTNHEANKQNWNRHNSLSLRGRILFGLILFLRLLHGNLGPNRPTNMVGRSEEVVR